MDKKPVVLVLCSADKKDASWVRVVKEALGEPEFQKCEFIYVDTFLEARRLVEEQSDITHVLIVSVWNLGTDAVVDFVLWLRASPPGKENWRFYGPVIVASGLEECQVAVVKAGADYAIPKRTVLRLLPAILESTS